jgi:hypothetical protein
MGINLSHKDRQEAGWRWAFSEVDAY